MVKATPKKQKKSKPKKQKLDLSSLEGAKPGEIEIPPFQLQNVVSTFTLGVKDLNLKHIALKYHFLEYNPQVS
jgi:TATA-box binding protein (TBP) (component of TFIID and TFIIIB)